MKHTEVGHAGASHGSLKDYVIGFVLSVILTAIPFAMVMDGSLDKTVVLYSILIMAVIQIVVHLVYFLHMNRDSEGGWNLLSLAYTIMTIGILVIGSIWIMNHLNHNMMGL